jgi:hypothetical protein
MSAVCLVEDPFWKASREVQRGTDDTGLPAWARGYLSGMRRIPMRWIGLTLVVVAIAACAKRPEHSKLPNGEVSGHEMPEPVDDSVVVKTDEQPEQPEPPKK